ncbi:MAG: RNA methyltransferase [Bacteroidales bacterium]|nr:RNA methyltransferase [Bacteroidales bacterium]
MLSSSRIKYINFLKINKYRKKYGQFIAEGPKLVTELINSHFKIIKIFALNNRLIENFSLIGNKQIEQIEITEKELKKISALKTPNQILAIVEIPQYIFNFNMTSSELVLILDEIKDPGNLGTIIRTADWFGINNIICSNNSVDLYNPKVVQATMGSIARVKVYYYDLEKFLCNIPEQTKIYGTFLRGKNIYKIKLVSNGIIVIGNESKGISKNLSAFIKEKIFIPSFDYENDNLITPESLNASIATAIICAEFRRQQNWGNEDG